MRSGKNISSKSVMYNEVRNKIPPDYWDIIMKNPSRKVQFLFVFFALVFALSCTQEEIASQVAQAGKTAVILAKTESVPLQTQAALAAQTAIAEAGKIAGTQVANFEKTAAARIKAEVATRIKNPFATSVNKMPVIDYFALGDSIASGYGLQPDGPECFQSPNSYPNQVIQMLKDRYEQVNATILACAGATVHKPDQVALDQDPKKWFQNQVDQADELISDRLTLITITIGANDFGWADIGKFLDHLYNDNNPEFENWVNGIVDDDQAGLRMELTRQVGRLLAHINVAVVITEVYNPANPKSILFLKPSPKNPCGMSAEACHILTEYMVTKLNSGFMDVYYNLGKPDRLLIAPLKSTFDAHASAPPCGLVSIQETWIQIPGDSNSDAARPVLGTAGGDCIHPNEKGAQAIAGSVNREAMILGR
jgi:lysophospholipase L1-like esterase